MNCPDIRENLVAYLDDEIEGAPRRAMDAHFTTCATCAGERVAMASTWALLDREALPASVADESPSTNAAFRARLHQSITSGAGASGGRLLRMAPAIGATAAAGLLAVAGWAWMGSHTESPSGDSPAGKGDDPSVTNTASAPPQELLINLALLENLDLVQDEDLQDLETLAELDPDDFGILGG
jgi:anti-sigma factor RsiW